jgi:hypothetical protein
LNNARFPWTKFKMILCLIGVPTLQVPVWFRKSGWDALIIVVICLMTNLSSLESFLSETVCRSNVAQDTRWIYHRLTLFPAWGVAPGNKTSPFERTAINEHFDFHSFHFGLPSLVMLTMVWNTL